MNAIIPAPLIEQLRAARYVAVVTGAGISAESGIPTFRDALEGLWSQYDPMELATPEGFARDPVAVTRWYDWRRQKCSAARPNSGHLALARLETIVESRGGAFCLITQNVDRLHQAAGSRDVIELHGSLWTWRCARCGAEREEHDRLFESYPPRCACGGVRRPSVVWFGEPLPAAALAQAYRAAGNCDLFLSIGTSAVVYPAAGLAHAARQRRTPVAEINAENTPLSALAEWSIRSKAGEALPELVRQAFGS